MLPDPMNRGFRNDGLRHDGFPQWRLSVDMSQMINAMLERPADFGLQCIKNYLYESRDRLRPSGSPWFPKHADFDEAHEGLGATVRYRLGVEHLTPTKLSVENAWVYPTAFHFPSGTRITADTITALQNFITESGSPYSSKHPYLTIKAGEQLLFDEKLMREVALRPAHAGSDGLNGMPLIVDANPITFANRFADWVLIGPPRDDEKWPLYKELGRWPEVETAITFTSEPFVKSNWASLYPTTPGQDYTLVLRRASDDTCADLRITNGGPATTTISVCKLTEQLYEIKRLVEQAIRRPTRMGELGLGSYQESLY